MQAEMSKEVTHYLTCSQDDIGELYQMLQAWNLDIGQKLPDGPSDRQLHIVSVVHHAYEQGVR